MGSVDAVTKTRKGPDGPLHWRKFITKLKDNSTSLSSPNPEVFTSSRVGDSFPICCPRHNTVQICKEIRKPSDFPSNSISDWKRFCNLPCSTPLQRCGHLCIVPCHPLNQQHTQKCQNPVARPCQDHLDIPLLCSNVLIEPKEGLIAALKRHSCEVIVAYRRKECVHICNVTCHMNGKLLAGLEKAKECEEIVADYYHPVCNHVTKTPKCHIRRSFESHTPQCSVHVQHKRPCGCFTAMKCFESVAEGLAPSLCKEFVNCRRPRCGHSLSLRCFCDSALQELWNSQVINSYFNISLLLNIIYKLINS